MRERGAVSDVVWYWFGKADEALESAKSESEEGRTAFAVNRCYYAAFYAASAVLLAMGYSFVKHSGVRAAVHLRLVKTGRVAAGLGRAYDRLFQDRQESDYVAFTEFTDDEVRESVADATALVTAFRGLLRESALSEDDESPELEH
ncbi:MAG TPA: HEPN domain-containing protein [Acidimicrobiia bacterium]|nr:HEPN domain-containing protein [Acidimicrobiia bacterium]